LLNEKQHHTAGIPQTKLTNAGCEYKKKL